MIFSRLTKRSIRFFSESLRYCPCSSPGSAILKPNANEEFKGELLQQLKINQYVQHGQPHPIAFSFSALDLIEMVTSRMLITARNLCVCEHHHSVLKRKNESLKNC